MRWRSLFDDLESQLAAQLRAEQDDRRQDELRFAMGRTSLRGRLAALLAERDRALLAPEPDRGAAMRILELDCRLVDGRALRIRLQAVGGDWCSGALLDPGPPRHAVLPLAAIAQLLLPAGAPAEAVAEPEGPPSLTARIGLAFVLRDLARRRVPLDARTAAGALHGTVGRVGGDHCELAVHERGVPPREGAVHGLALLPFAALHSLTFRAD